MRPLRFGILPVALLLAGCFASKEPLVDPAAADTPIAGGSKFAESINCDGSLGSLLGCKGFKHSGSGTLVVDHGTYSIHPDAADNPLAGVPGQAAPTQDVSFLMKKIGDDLYAVELPFGDKDSSSGSNADANYIYEVMKISGNTAFLYVLTCEKNGDSVYVRSGALSKIADVLMTTTCEPASLGGLGKIAADRIANGAVPDTRLDITPPAS